MAEATSGNSGRGQSISCISGSETITVLIGKEVCELPLEYAYDIFGKDIITKNDDNICINI